MEIDAGATWMLPQPARASGGIAIGAFELDDSGASGRKYADLGVERTIPPSETIRRVGHLMPRIGVTRIGEVSRLDRAGVPNFVAVRPREWDGGISYYNGKGFSRSQARAGAMMEAIERHSGEICDLPVTVSSFERLRRDSAVVDPNELLVPRVHDCPPDLMLEWVEGFDMIARRTTYVPLNAVICPYQPSPGAAAPLFASTNGLASGNTRADALCHALCEINERDAISLDTTATRLRASVQALIGGRREPAAEHARISNDGLPVRHTRFLRRLLGVGLRVYLRDITSDTAIPTISCYFTEQLGVGRHVAHGGFGCHPDARVALSRALTEAAQSRTACIQGGREDLPEFAGSEELVRDPDAEFGDGPQKLFEAVVTKPFQTIGEDVSWILERFRAAGFRQVVAVDLTRPELGVPVVRVVVPNAEGWAVYRIHTDGAPMGLRALRVLSDKRGA